MCVCVFVCGRERERERERESPRPLLFSLVCACVRERERDRDRDRERQREKAMRYDHHGNALTSLFYELCCIRHVTCKWVTSHDANRKHEQESGCVRPRRQCPRLALSRTVLRCVVIPIFECVVYYVCHEPSQCMTLFALSRTVLRCVTAARGGIAILGWFVKHVGLYPFIYWDCF